jgi:hypothetical protein
MFGLISMFGLAAAAPSLAAATVETDAPLQQLLAESARAPVVAFERTTRIESRVDPKAEPALIVDRFMPESRATGSWTIVSVDGHKPSPHEAEAHAMGNAAPPGFHNLHRLLGPAPTSRRESGGKTIYFWKSLPKGAVVTPGGDISSHLSAEATLRGSELEEVRIFASRPFHVKVVASVKRFNIISQYRPGGNGLPFLSAQTNDTDVTAPLGMGAKRRSTASFRPL